MAQPVNLVVFDADDTLWVGLDGGFIAGVNYQDEGSDDYTFHSLDDLHIQRSDGQRFRLFPEVRIVLPDLYQRGVLISLASYNHPGPALRALKAFQIEQFFQHAVIEWSNRKDFMLQHILGGFSNDGYQVSPRTTLFVDDDMHGKYRRQMANIGVNFLQRGEELHDLTEILDHPGFVLQPAHKKHP